jgi:hypothetical protein
MVSIPYNQFVVVASADEGTFFRTSEVSLIAGAGSSPMSFVTVTRRTELTFIRWIDTQSGDTTIAKIVCYAASNSGDYDVSRSRLVRSIGAAILVILPAISHRIIDYTILLFVLKVMGERHQ